MAGTFNIAKGRVNELVNRAASGDPANSAIVVVLLKVAEADATLQDYATLGALLAGSNTEADFTSYGRKSPTVTAPAPDDTDNSQSASIGNQTWTAAGGTTDNTLVKLLVCYDPDTTSGDDTAIIPLTHHDFATTTDGADLVAQEHADGFFKAS